LPEAEVLSEALEGNTKNWEIKKLGKVCEIELGKTPYRKDGSYWDKEKQTDNVWLSISDLLNTENKFVYDSKEYISNKATSICKIVKKGTLLLSFKLTIGRLAFAGKDLYTNEAIAALKIRNEKYLDKFYLYNYLLFFDWEKATEGESKVKGKTLNKSKLKELDIIIPSLPEQKRIVSILDKVFSAIEQSRNNAEQNLKNTKELFKSYLNRIFSPENPEALEGWEEKKLGEVYNIPMMDNCVADNQTEYHLPLMTNADRTYL
jgi:type I restriction enzyme S subunit